MEQVELKKILSSEYSLDKWKPVLSLLFGKIDYFTKGVEIDDALIKSGGQIGNIRLDDGKTLALFEMEVADSIKIPRNRKGLRDIAVRYIDQSLIHGALVFYYSRSQKDYRFTYIAKQTYFTPEGELRTNETAPKRYTFLLGENESCTTAAIRILELAAKKKKGSVYFIDVTDAFSVEKLNTSFFERYRKFHKDFCLYIIAQEKIRTSIFGIEIKEDVDHAANKPVRDFVKKMMGRVVFLHFLQKKGWMGCPADITPWIDGDKEFMLNLFNDFANKEHFYSQCLVRLFFETLNNNERGTKQVFELTGTRVPYLNGGLFDEDTPKARGLDFSAELFGDFLNFFAEYNFTIDENSPDEQEVGIDPEMLGHIFENLLEDNKDKGTFYTPKEIVQYMCRQSLTEYLKSHTDESLHSYIDQLITRHEVAIEIQNAKTAELLNTLLKEVKICDPAIGSGAFPMGILTEIFALRRLLFGHLGGNAKFSPVDVKKEIIQNCIYGVDIEKGAVDIARLRFWLSLVVDETVPQPLPNLDFKIMQGNSLLESYKDTDLSGLLEEEDKTIYAKMGIIDFGDESFSGRTDVLLFDSASKQELQSLIDLYFDFEQGHQTQFKDKYAVKSRISEIVEGKLLAKMALDKNRIEAEISQTKTHIDGNVVSPTDPIGVKKKKEGNIAKLTKQLSALESKLDEAHKSIEELRQMEENGAEKPYFLWHTFFKDVFDKGGFDIVIGNPPYIQMQANGGILSEQLKDAGFETFARTADIYCLFYEKGIQILCDGGVECFITSNKWMRAGYGEKIRSYFSEFNPLLLLDLGAGVFESATVDTNILVVQKSANQGCLQGATYTARDFKEIKYAPVLVAGGDAWTLLSPTEQLIKTRIESVGIPLKDWDISIYRGVLTGYNEAFIIDTAKRDELVAADPRSAEIIKPILRGRDIKRYSADWAGLWLIFIPWHFPLHNDNSIQGSSERAEEAFKIQYPVLYKHLLSHKEALSKRNKAETGIRYEWYALQRCAATYYEEFEKEKIIFQEMVQESSFIYDRIDRLFCLDTARIITGNKLDYLVSILNSKLFFYAVKYFYGGGGLGATGVRMKHTFFENFVCPQLSISDQQPFINLVNYVILLRSKGMAQISDLVSNDFIASYFEEIIDGCVYELYFEEHMKEREIDILDEVAKRIKPIDHCLTDQEKSAVILDVFTNIKKTDNPIRTRLELFVLRSPEYLKPIIQG